VYLISSFFWEVMWRRLVNRTVSRTTYRPHLQRSKKSRRTGPLGPRNITGMFFSPPREKSVTNYHPKQRNTPEQQGPPKMYVLTALYVCLMKHYISCLLRNNPVSRIFKQLSHSLRSSLELQLAHVRILIRRVITVTFAMILLIQGCAKRSF
jgi:hypothetical protein